MPSLAIIGGFKGSIDFYYWCGIVCVRSWPKSPGKIRSAAVEAQWTAFTWASQNWKNISAEVQAAYIRMAAGTNMSGRDMFVKSYLSPIYVRLE